MSSTADRPLLVACSACDWSALHLVESMLAISTWYTDQKTFKKAHAEIRSEARMHLKLYPKKA